MIKKTYYLVADRKSNSRESTVNAFYYFITASEKEQYLKWFKEVAEIYPDEAITYYNDDDEEIDSITAGDIVKILEKAKEVTEEEMKTLKKLVPEVIRKYNELPEYVEMLTDKINEYDEPEVAEFKLKK
jgi:hypothetical protein